MRTHNPHCTSVLSRMVDFMLPEADISSWFLHIRNVRDLGSTLHVVNFLLYVPVGIYSVIISS
ncbi:hypothetical protein BGW80DRAFT_143546 [Lactifluus volemus]|nr:hypothetical protein BGW80DRAFT_143546 [Lactifluus volemus]